MLQYSRIYFCAALSRNVSKYHWWLLHSVIRWNISRLAGRYRLLLCKYFPRPLTGCWRFWSQRSWHLNTCESWSRESFFFFLLKRTQEQCYVLIATFPPKNPKTIKVEEPVATLVWTRAMPVFDGPKTKPERKDRDGLDTDSRVTEQTWLAPADKKP